MGPGDKPADTPGDEQWRFETDGSVWSSPAVIDDTVYVGSGDNHLYAVDAGTGEERWQFDADGSIELSPAVVDDTVCVGSDDHNLYAVDAATGDERWCFETGRWVRSSPAMVDGTVYVGSDDGHLYAVDGATGDERWRFTTDRRVRSSPAVVDDTVYIGSDDGHLYAVDATTGDERWSFETDRPVRSSPAVAGGTVYVGSDDFNLYAVDAATGDEQWRFDTDKPVRSSPAVVDDTVYVGSYDGHLYAVDAEAGDEQWRVDINGTVHSSPAVADDTVYVGNTNSILYAVNTSTSDVRWSFRTDEGVWSSPAVIDDTVYVGSDDGNLYAVAADASGLPTARGLARPAVSLRMLFSEAGDAVTDAVTARERDDYDTADDHWERAHDLYDRAETRAERIGKSWAAEDAREALDRVVANRRETREEAARYRLRTSVSGGDGRLEAAAEMTADGDYAPARQQSDRAREQYERALTLARDNGLGDTAPVERRLIEARIQRERIRIGRANEAFTDDDAYEARERLTVARRRLADLRDEAADAPGDWQSELDDLIEQCETGIETVKRALIRPGDADGDLSGISEIVDTRESVSFASVATPSEDGPRSRPSTPLPGDDDLGGSDELPPHETLGKVDDGGQATVYKLQLTESDRVVALKRPRIEGTLGRRPAQQFLRRARRWSRVDDHPAIPTVYDWGTSDSPPYVGPWLLLEFCGGGDLGDYVGQLSTTRALKTLERVADAVHHAEGVNHLDIKPANVLLTESRTPKLGDWGLARRALERSETGVDTGLSLPYAAPEQLSAASTTVEPGRRTDVYQLGVTAYELLTGERPFDGAGDTPLERQILETRPEPPSRVAAVPERVDEVVQTAMARDPADRYDGANTLRAALREARDAVVD